MFDGKRTVSPSFLLMRLHHMEEQLSKSTVYSKFIKEISELESGFMSSQLYGQVFTSPVSNSQSRPSGRGSPFSTAVGSFFWSSGIDQPRNRIPCTDRRLTVNLFTSPMAIRLAESRLQANCKCALSGEDFKSWTEVDMPSQALMMCDSILGRAPLKSSKPDILVGGLLQSLHYLGPKVQNPDDFTNNMRTKKRSLIREKYEQSTMKAFRKG